MHLNKFDDDYITGVPRAVFEKFDLNHDNTVHLQEVTCVLRYGPALRAVVGSVLQEVFPVVFEWLTQPLVCVFPVVFAGSSTLAVVWQQYSASVIVHLHMFIAAAHSQLFSSTRTVVVQQHTASVYSSSTSQLLFGSSTLTAHTHSCWTAAHS